MLILIAGRPVRTMEQSQHTPDRQWILPDSLVAAVLPVALSVAAYFVALTREIGACTAYGVPVEFIVIGPGEVFRSLLPLLFFGLISLPLMLVIPGPEESLRELLIKQARELNVNWRREVQRAFMGMLRLTAVYVLVLSGVGAYFMGTLQWHLLLSLAALIAVLIAPPLYLSRAPDLSSALRRWDRWRLPTLAFSILALTTSYGLIHGAAEAALTRSYLVVPGNPERVVLRVYSDKMMCAPLARSKRHFGRAILIRHLGDNARVVLHHEPVGPLTRSPQ
ncbi:MAG: hypothetical protein ACK47B_10925 [Armatimonadota bacterium]